MNLKQLQKATAIIEDIEVLDSKIKEIENFGIIISNGSANVSFDLILSNLKEVGPKKEILDADGSLKKEGEQPRQHSIFDVMRMAALGIPREVAPQIKKNELVMQNDIDDVPALEILGVLYSFYSERKEKLLKSLEKLGVKL